MTIIESPLIDIVSSGNEILEGLYPDTNANWLSRRLTDLGYRTRGHMTIGDSIDELREGLAWTLGRSSLTIMSGGLGPTADDLTREAVGELFGAPVELHPEGERSLRERFADLGRPVTENNIRQAYAPRGAKILPNAVGTAPGFALRAPRPDRALIALPGPPHELRRVWGDHAEAWLLANFPLARRAGLRVLRTVGRTESDLDVALAEWRAAQSGLYLGFRAGGGFIDLRCRIESDDAGLESRWERARAELSEIVGSENIFGEGEVELHEATAQALLERGATVTCAESCTGGMLAQLLTSVPGSSAYIERAFVTYANSAKIEALGVQPETLERHGAVSGECAAEMALGAREAARADYAISITGVAGPSGGTAEKPVGLVWFGLADRDGVRTVEKRFLGDRRHNRQRATRFALDLLRRQLLTGQ